MCHGPHAMVHTQRSEDQGKSWLFYCVDSKDEPKHPYWLSHLTNPFELGLQTNLQETTNVWKSSSLIHIKAIFLTVSNNILYTVQLLQSKFENETGIELI